MLQRYWIAGLHYTFNRPRIRTKLFALKKQLRLQLCRMDLLEKSIFLLVVNKHTCLRTICNAMLFIKLEFVKYRIKGPANVYTSQYFYASLMILCDSKPLNALRILQNAVTNHEIETILYLQCAGISFVSKL